MRKCVICDEKHDEHFHNPEFATENIDNDEKCSKGSKTEESDFVKTTFKVNVKKKVSVGITIFIIFLKAFCLSVFDRNPYRKLI